MSEENRITEYLKPQLPSPLEIADLRALPAEIIRSVAECANNAGLSGKRIDGMEFRNDRGPLPEIVFEVSSAKPKTVTDVNIATQSADDRCVRIIRENSDWEPEVPPSA